MNDNNIEKLAGSNQEKKQLNRDNALKRASIILGSLLAISSYLVSCTPAAKSGMVGNETTTAIGQNYEKIKVSPEAATRALAARERFNQERPSQPFEVTLGDITFKIIPGEDPDHPGNPFRVMEDNYTVYADYSRVPKDQLFVAVAQNIVKSASTIMWRDVLEEEDGNPNSKFLSIGNRKWLDAIESCDFGLEALLGLAGVKGFENVKWEDYCHPGIPKTPIYKPVKRQDY